MTIRRRYPVVEGQNIRLDPGVIGQLRPALFRLQSRLKLSLPVLEEDSSGFRIRNLIGAIDLGNGVVVDVEPKTEPGDDWVRSVLSLLIGDDPVDAAGDRSGGQKAARPDLVEAIAAIYAARLERALRRDGPLLTMGRTAQSAPHLKGKLDVDRWLAAVFVDPVRFPVSYDVLTPDNEFTTAMAHVCHLLRTSSRRAATRARLSQMAALLRPGLPALSALTPGIEHRRLPPQWAVYGPAWSITCAVLARRSLLGPSGRLFGVSIAIEAWPLLERLLERSLRAAAVETGTLEAPAKTFKTLLSRTAATGRMIHELEPDGVLVKDGAAVAAFEAKYRDFDPASGPLRTEIYQALAAARAVSAPVSVLVYPNRFETIAWNVAGTGAPTRLLAVGLDLFGYAQGGEVERARDLLKSLNDEACLSGEIA